MKRGELRRRPCRQVQATSSVALAVFAVVALVLTSCYNGQEVVSPPEPEPPTDTCALLDPIIARAVLSHSMQAPEGGTAGLGESSCIWRAKDPRFGSVELRVVRANAARTEFDALKASRDVEPVHGIGEEAFVLVGPIDPATSRWVTRLGAKIGGLYFFLSVDAVEGFRPEASLDAQLVGREVAAGITACCLK